MRGVGRDPIRGGHYGQRSCEPRQKAEHMAAPTNAAKREESPCQPGAVHTWHVASLRCYAAIRRLSRHSGLWRGVGPADLWVHGLVNAESLKAFRSALFTRR